MKHHFKPAALLLSLLFSAAALSEGIVLEAPAIDLFEIDPPMSASGNYLPDESIYYNIPAPTPSPIPVSTVNPISTPAPVAYEAEWTAASDPVSVSWKQYPALNQSETARALTLLDAYERGERTGDGESVLNALENVVVGVYALDPAQYAGERAYVLLPGTELTDEQILSLIDAFHRLGLRFSPENLSYMNCARGGSTESSRCTTEEESLRYSAIVVNINQGRLLLSEIPESAWQDQYFLTLNPDAYCGLDFFAIRPYRLLTDDELAAMACAAGVEPIGDLTCFESAAYTLARALGAAMSVRVASTSTGTSRFMANDENGQPAQAEELPIACVTCLSTGEACSDRYVSIFHRLTGETLAFSWSRVPSFRYFPEEDSSLTPAYSSAQCLEAARDTAQRILDCMRLENLEYAQGVRAEAESAGVAYADCGLCHAFRAELACGWLMNILVSPIDGNVYQVEVSSQGLIREDGH